MQGELSLACLNRSRTREAPTPTNISTKSLPEMLKNGTSASPGDGLGQQGLAASGRTDQQDAARNAPAEPLEFPGVPEKLDDLGDLFLRLVNARPRP